MTTVRLQPPQPSSSIVDTQNQSGTDERLTLLDLADELQDLIIVNLDPGAALALSHTNRHFRSCVDLHRLPFPVVSRYIQEKETLPENKNRYACYTCFRFKPQSNFIMKQTQRRRSKLGADARKRLCIDCGYKNGKHVPGRIFKTSAGLRILCDGCETLRNRFCLCCSWCNECISKGAVTMVKWRQWVKPGLGAREILVTNICDSHFWIRLSGPDDYSSESSDSETGEFDVRFRRN